jgi:hypothetical protein
MEARTPFAQAPTTPESIIAQVRRQLAGDSRFGTSISTDMLDLVADRAVRELWDSRVKTYVPVLALRRARALLLETGPLIAVVQRETIDNGSPAAGEQHRVEHPSRDVLHLDSDVFLHGDRDVLRL